ncbi:MAG TPA: porin [Pseudoduganella sp.]
MKNKVLTAALLATCAGGAYAQGSNVQVYGRLNIAIENMRTTANSAGKGVTITREVNNRSVIGFKGTEDLGGGNKALFQIEGTVSPDTGEGEIARRDTRVGLEGAWGTAFAGHWVTAYNGATSSLDPWYPTTAGYMNLMANGAGSSVDNVSNVSSFDRRQANSVHYWSPQWNGFQLRVTHGLSEERPASGAHPSLTSAAGIWEQGPWYVTAAYERHHEYQGKGFNDQGAKVGVAYRFGDTRIAVVGERLEYETATGDLNRNAFFVALTHQLGAHNLRLTATRANDGKGSSTAKIGFVKKGPDTGATQFTLGDDYSLSKRTSVFVYYTHLKNEANGVYDFPINALTVSPGAKLRGAALGLRHFF